MAGQEEHESSDTTARSSPRVLVVEDNGLIAAKLAQVLRRGGYAVVGLAATLAAALDLLRAYPGRVWRQQMMPKTKCSRAR
jgi:CheY-like chemotaxis protein